jgi:hypothetical protein
MPPSKNRLLKTGKPLVVWLVPRKRQMRRIFSPRLWGKCLIQSVLVILAMSAGFYAAQHHQRSLRMTGDIDTIVTTGEDSRKSIKTDYDRLRVPKIDYMSNLPVSGHIIVRDGHSAPKTALMQPLKADGRKRMDQIIVADAQTAVENGQDFYLSQSYHPITTKPPTGRGRFRHLDHQLVEQSLADPDRMRRQVTIKPAETYGRPAGFRFTSIQSGSIFNELGLRSTDVIVGINGAAITTPDQADLLFQSIKTGGDVTIQVKGKRRNRIIHLDIS